MRRALGLGVVAGLIGLALPMAARAETPECEWLAGDFHVHTVYSHDSYGGPEDENSTFEDDGETFGWTPMQQGAIAESRGLDYIAITDHDNVDAYLRRDDPATGLELYESGWGRPNQVPGGEPLVWIPDYEANVAGGGHAQMHGATKTYDEAPPPDMAAALRADGGAFQINHPSDGSWHDADGNYRYPGFVPDALEIWNIGVWFYEPPMPATNDHEFTPQMYDTEFLDLGFHVAATGGSDNHWRTTTAAQGVGQPTTWVCSTGRSASEIIDAVKANRTSISHQPPAYMGARAYLYANDGAAMIGDTVAPGSTIQAVVENAEGAWLQIVTNGGEVLAKDPVTSFNFSKSYAVPADSTWVRAEVFYEDGRAARNELQPLCDLSNDLFGREERDERNTYCENRLAMVAMTSPIYFEQAEFDPATTLTYVGDTSVRVGDNATFAAVLTDSNGDPLAGQSVAFTFRDETLTATTDESGRAEVTTRVVGPPGEETLLVDFAGTDTYDPAHLEQVVSVTTGQ